MLCFARDWIQASNWAVAVLCVSSWHSASHCATQEKTNPVALEAKAGSLTEHSQANQTATSAPKKADQDPLAGRAPSAAPSTSTRKVSATNPDARYKELNKDRETTPQTKARRTAGSGMLIPPPPPTIPAYLNLPAISTPFGLGFSVPLMSLDDLKFEHKNLEKKLEAAKQDEQDQKRATAEKQERAQRFVDLFAEGVVSRRELETAQRDAERSVRDLEQSHIKVSEIDRVYLQVKERIKTLEPVNKPTKLSTQKSRTR